MPCTKQSTRRYTDRNSPPYPGNQCPEGMRLRGNDGSWYVVSKPNVNGIKRWVRAKAPTRRKKSAPPRPSVRPTTPSPRRKLPRRPPSPRRNLLENVPWRMASRVDNGMVMQARVYLTEPSGLYFMYEVLYERFVEMTSDATVIGIDRAQQLIEDGFKVWVVSSSPIDLELD